jgi:hypothetical protein
MNQASSKQAEHQDPQLHHKFRNPSLNHRKAVLQSQSGCYSSIYTCNKKRHQNWTFQSHLRRSLHSHYAHVPFLISPFDHTISLLCTLPLNLMDNLNNLIDNTRIRKSTRITQTIFLSSDDLSQDTTHDLATSCLWEIGDDVDEFGSCEGSDTVITRLLAYLSSRLPLPKEKW